ncbi:MAG TPA: CBS domain-containing protein [Chloroflexota bacterium]|nr:CBS domain-containing protein [Chloroflexota bacterium]
MKVRDIMTQHVVTVTEDTPVLAVARVLSEKRISAVPVCGSDGAVVGLVSEFDLLAREGKTAREVMTPGIISVSEDTDVEEVRFLLIERRIKRVPVMNGQRLVGIVSRADIVRELTLHWICEVCGEMIRAKEPPPQCWKCGTADRFRNERQNPGM